MKVRKLLVEVGADTAAYDRGMKSARAKLKNLTGQIKKMGVVMAAAATAVVGAVGLMVKNYVEAGDWIDKMSKRTGIGATALSELAYAADISGASLNDVEKSVKKMAKAITDADEGLESYLRVFRRLGLDVEKLKAMSPEDQFLKIGRAIARLGDESLQAATAQEVFGRAGTTLLPLFKESTEEINRLRGEAHRLGKVFDAEAAAKAAKLKDSLTALRGSLQGIQFAIADEVVPALTIFADAITDKLVEIRGDARGLTESLLGFFKVLMQGVQGVLAGIQILRAAWYDLNVAINLQAKSLYEKVLPAYFLLAKILPGAREEFVKLGKAYAQLLIDIERYADASDAATDSAADAIVLFDELIAALNEIDTAYTKVSETLTTTAIPPVRELGDVLEEVEGVAVLTARSLKFIGTALSTLKSEIYEVKEATMTWQEELLGYLAQAQQAVQGLDSVFGQFHSNEAQRIENSRRAQSDAIEEWYEQRRAAIEQTVMDEEAKVAALEALDEEKARKQNELEHRVEKETRKLERERAKAQKATALMAATINVAEAIVKALTAGPIIGQILAGVVAALGAVQIAAIAAAPLPALAKGGYIEKEMVARLHPGELVLSPAHVKALASPDRMIGTFSPTVIINTKTLDDRTIRQAGEKIYAELQRQQRRFG